MVLKKEIRGLHIAVLPWAGIARLRPSCYLHSTNATQLLSPQYLAPEVLRKQSYDKSVDWWCLGAVTYEMMYGLPPFYSRDTAEM